MDQKPKSHWFYFVVLPIDHKPAVSNLNYDQGNCRLINKRCSMFFLIHIKFICVYNMHHLLISSIHVNFFNPNSGITNYSIVQRLIKACFNHLIFGVSISTLQASFQRWDHMNKKKWLDFGRFDFKSKYGDKTGQTRPNNFMNELYRTISKRNHRISTRFNLFNIIKQLNIKERIQKHPGFMMFLLSLQHKTKQ